MAPPIGVILGALVLLHATYSSYEWVSLNKLLSSGTTVRCTSDVRVELVIGLIILTLSIVSQGVSKLKPINISDLNSAKALLGEDSYAYLDTRPNFQDLVAKRHAFLEWRKEAASQNSTEPDLRK